MSGGDGIGKLRIPDYRRFKKYLRSKGFYFSRFGKGDHEIWTNGERSVTLDPGQDPPKIGTFKSMLEDAGLGEEDFRD